MSDKFLERIAAQTEELIEYLRLGCWDEVRSQFDASLAAALDREQLAAVWTKIHGEAGSLLRHDPARSEGRGGMTIATSRLEFEEAELSLCAVFNSDLAIAGLTIRPVETTE